jgi:hypothetical protein
MSVGTLHVMDRRQLLKLGIIIPLVPIEFYKNNNKYPKMVQVKPQYMFRRDVVERAASLLDPNKPLLILDKKLSKYGDVVEFSSVQIKFDIPGERDKNLQEYYELTPWLFDCTIQLRSKRCPSYHPTIKLDI